jgi:hypothetical protein
MTVLDNEKKLAAGGSTSRARRLSIPHDKAIVNTKTKMIMNISILAHPCSVQTGGAAKKQIPVKIRLNK